MSRIIECHVNDEYILGSGVPIGAAGSHDDVALRLIFNEMWDGLNIVATFKDALAESETVIQLMPSMLEEGDSRTYLIWIPGGAKKYAGRVKLTLSGYSVYAVEGNGTRIYKKDSLTNTAAAFFRVLESDAAIVKDDEDSETTYKEMVQADLNAFVERMTAFEGDIDARANALENAENGYVDEEGNPVPGRVGAELEREKAEATRKSNEDKRIDAEGSIEEQKGRVWAEKQRTENEKTRQAFYNTAFVGLKSEAEDSDGAGYFNNYSAAVQKNKADARASTVFGYHNQIVKSDQDLKEHDTHKRVFKNDFVPDFKKNIYGNVTNGRHGFLAGGENVLTGYSAVGLGECLKICGSRAVAVGYCLRAYSANQFICGKWNVPDYPLDDQENKCNDSSQKGKYAFIVGNGKDGAPSNAFAVDWEGNAYISRELYIGEVSLTNEIYSLKGQVGDISRALDEIHAYAMNKIGGNET